MKNEESIEFQTNKSEEINVVKKTLSIPSNVGSRLSFLPSQCIEEFQKLYQDGGVALTWEDSTDKAESFIGMYNEVVYGEYLKNKEGQPMEKN